MHRNIHCKHITGSLRTTCGHPDRPKRFGFWRSTCELCFSIEAKCEAFEKTAFDRPPDPAPMNPSGRRDFGRHGYNPAPAGGLPENPTITPAPPLPMFHIADHPVKSVNAVFIDSKQVDWRRITHEYIIPEIQKTTGRGGAEQ